MLRATAFVLGAFLVASSSPVSAQPPPTGPQPYEPTVPAYNGSLAPQMYPGGSQHELYRDMTPEVAPSGFYTQIVNLTACGISTPHYHPGLTELNYVLSGSDLIAGVILILNGSSPAWATGILPGQVATVPESAVHYAENPTCGTISLLQIFSGLPQEYNALPYVDLPTSLLGMSALSMKASYGLSAAGLQTAIQTVQPLFDVNRDCLAACQASQAQG